MVDVILSTQDLDVFGGPSSINVSTDFGKPGIRGPIFWVGNGDPDSSLTTNQKAQVNINDFFINNGSNPVDYSWLYKRVQSIGGDGAIWEKVLRLNQQQYSVKTTVPFSSGIGNLDILLTNITRDDSSQTNFINRFIIRSRSLSKVIKPLRSRCCCLNIVSPTTNDIFKTLVNISCRIHQLEGNLPRDAISLLENR
jgi:hypothetical protein